MNERSVSIKKPLVKNKIIISRVVEIMDDNPKTLRTQGDANISSILGTDFPLVENTYLGKIVEVLQPERYP